MLALCILGAAAALQLPATGDAGRRSAIGLITAMPLAALPLPSHAALMPVCSDEVTTACRRPYKLTNMGGRGGDINAPNKYASGLGAIAEKEIALKAKIAKAKAQQESVKARYGRSRRGQRDADAARAGAD